MASNPGIVNSSICRMSTANNRPIKYISIHEYLLYMHTISSCGRKSLPIMSRSFQSSKNKIQIRTFLMYPKTAMCRMSTATCRSIRYLPSMNSYFQTRLRNHLLVLLADRNDQTVFHEIYHSW